MAAIVVVHGVGKQFLGPRSLASAIVPALTDGIVLGGGPHIPQGAVDVAFYGHWFRQRHSDDGAVAKGGTHDLHPLERELLAQWWAEAARVAPDRVPPPEPAYTGKAATPRAVQRALHALSRLLPARITERFLLGVLRQVRLYLTDPHVRTAAQSELAAVVSPETRVVVAHSLGSVIAYETLAARPEWEVAKLVTLGSPLGVPRLIFDRLVPAPSNGRGAWPGAVRSWTNLNDRHDVVALVKRLAPLFDGGPLHDVTVDNGWQTHDLLHHLTARETGTAIAEGLE
ncbi:hypothetical protein [Streptomyces mutabilis]|uniref:hypothetical protein n=1 Tax=Streptomyces mutabilis TaxID=67332 RepID=UPI0034DF8D06